MVGLLAVALAGVGHADVRAWVDSSQVASDGSIQLTLEHDGSTSDEPDLAPLKQDFELLSSGRSSSIQIENGAVSSRVQVQVTLAPKHGGPITIPAITWGNEQSSPIPIKFGGSAAPNAQNAPSSPQANAPGGSNGPDSATTSSKGNVFLETTVDSKEPYVQAGVTMTVHIYAAVPLRHAVLDMPSTNDAVVQQIGADRRDFEVKDGQRYQVIERHYQVFPQRSGQVTLPAPVLDAQIPVRDRADPFADQLRGIFSDSILNNMMSSLRPIRVHGDEIKLNVLPRPGDAAEVWMPAHNVTLQADWQPSDASAKVGDPVTWHLHLVAQGLTAAQLPDLNSLVKLPPDLRAYPDQPRLDNDTHGDSVVGTRDQSIAIIADKPGQYTVPPLTLHWWDTDAKQSREITVPGRTFTVTAAGAAAPVQADASPSGVPVPAAAESRAPTPAPAAAAGEAPPAPKPVESRRWRVLSAALGVLWIVTMAAWYWTSRHRPPPRTAASDGDEAEIENPSAAQARAAFHEACRRNDARAARARLIKWLNAARPDAPTGSLKPLFAEAGDSGLTPLLLELDRGCYGGAPWNGEALLQALDELPKRPARSAKRAPALASLYP